MTVAVIAAGSLPGIRDTDLPTYLVGEMNSAGNATWHFEPGPATKQASLNRIEWSFKTNASAVGQVRTYGFSRALMQRLIGAHQFLTIEATLYLNGEYQTKSLSQINTTGGSTDRDLAAALIKDTRQLMAYSQMDTRVEAIGPGGKKLPAP
ncbi:MAG TPA: hypothetical protein VM689_02220 [Aliidongia sp.]|nr:hypothetical protein [Aliidongia sp.]